MAIPIKFSEFDFLFNGGVILFVASILLIIFLPNSAPLWQTVSSILLGSAGVVLTLLAINTRRKVKNKLTKTDWFGAWGMLFMLASVILLFSLPSDVLFLFSLVPIILAYLGGASLLYSFSLMEKRYPKATRERS